MKEKSLIALNSVMLYVSAFLATTMLHELAHAMSGMMFSSNPILHHNYVEHLSTEHLSTTQQVTTALAGPVISLLQGLVAGSIFLKTTRRGFLQLFLLWFSVLGFNNFLGYLMTGPFFGVGDIGSVYQLLKTPLWIQITAAVLGAGALLYIAYKLTTPFLSFSYKPDWVADASTRKNFSFHTLILPWIIGSVVVTVLYLPIIAIVSIIYPIMSGFVFIFPWQNAQQVQDVPLSGNENIGSFSMSVIGVLIVLAIIFKWILAPGIAL